MSERTTPPALYLRPGTDGAGHRTLWVQNESESSITLMLSGFHHHEAVDGQVLVHRNSLLRLAADPDGPPGCLTVTAVGGKPLAEPVIVPLPRLVDLRDGDERRAADDGLPGGGGPGPAETPRTRSPLPPLPPLPPPQPPGPPAAAGTAITGGGAEISPPRVHWWQTVAAILHGLVHRNRDAPALHHRL